MLIATFVVTKVVFVAYNVGDEHIDLGDVVMVLTHGLPQDLTTASYLAILPWVVCVVSVWKSGRWAQKALSIYAYAMVPLLCLIIVVDCGLYRFWQFKIDATILNYLDNPKAVIASVSGWYVVIGLCGVALLATVVVLAMRRIGKGCFPLAAKRLKALVALVLAGGCLFLMIRGGVGRSTMNLGHVYYSSNQFLNHSAVNPAFSLFYSILKYQDYNKLYHYYKDEECDKNFAELAYSTQSVDTEQLLNNQRPNIVLVLMEGLGTAFVEALGGEKNITPNINKLSAEGVSFTRCYANSFRTDRGIVCTLSGYPTFPDLSVMKLTEKAMDLPSIAKSLLAEGYSTSFLYGGDKNFTNANSYLLSTGYEQVMGDEYFPLSVRKTHSWGVTDEIVMDTLCNQIMRQATASDKPFFITCQTLASHEDWVVPYNRIKNNQKANAMAYLDHCIGQLVDKLRSTDVWQNLLLIFVSDHGISYPKNMNESNIEMSHIPLVWAGGAVARPKQVERICNQTDLVATLLGQLGLKHSEFLFSRDVMSKTYTFPCAIHTFSRGVSFVDSTGVTIEDLNSKRMLTEKPSANKRRIQHAHTLLQKTMADLATK